MNRITLEQELKNNGIERFELAAKEIRSHSSTNPEGAYKVVCEDADRFTSSFDESEITRIEKVLHSAIHQYQSGWIK